MSANRLRYSHIAVSALGAGLVLVVLLAALAGAHARAAPLRNLNIDSDPQVRRIIMTSNLPNYDPTGGAGISKNIYSNSNVDDPTLSLADGQRPSNSAHSGVIPIAGQETVGEIERDHSLDDAPGQDADHDHGSHVDAGDENAAIDVSIE